MHTCPFHDEPRYLSDNEGELYCSSCGLTFPVRLFTGEKIQSMPLGGGRTLLWTEGGVPWISVAVVG